MKYNIFLMSKANQRTVSIKGKIGIVFSKTKAVSRPPSERRTIKTCYHIFLLKRPSDLRPSSNYALCL